MDPLSGSALSWSVGQGADLFISHRSVERSDICRFLFDVAAQEFCVAFCVACCVFVGRNACKHSSVRGRVVAHLKRCDIPVGGLCSFGQHPGAVITYVNNEQFVRWPSVVMAWRHHVWAPWIRDASIHAIGAVPWQPAQSVRQCACTVLHAPSLYHHADRRTRTVLS